LSQQHDAIAFVADVNASLHVYAHRGFQQENTTRIDTCYSPWCVSPRIGTKPCRLKFPGSCLKSWS
jgi:hypothetical protein